MKKKELARFPPLILSRVMPMAALVFHPFKEAGVI